MTLSGSELIHYCNDLQYGSAQTKQRLLCSQKNLKSCLIELAAEKAISLWANILMDILA
jgi:hypothetical protein